MDIWVARRIARRARAKLVFEVHDLWPLSPIELSGMSPKHPFARLCSKAESDAYRDADVVVSMLPVVHSYMASRGLDLAKLAIVPNGISPDDWAAKPQPLRGDVAGTLATARAVGETVVGYAGSMGEPNALDTLLDAAALLRDDPVGRKLRFVLVGDGHLRASCRQRVPRRACPTSRCCRRSPSCRCRRCWPGRHRLHRLAARADLPLRHRAQQADGLHDGRPRGAALGGGRQRPGRRGGLRRDGGAAGCPCSRRRPAEDDAAGARGARGDGRARARVRAGAAHVSGAGEAVPGGAGAPAGAARRNDAVHATSGAASTPSEEGGARRSQANRHRRISR